MSHLDSLFDQHVAQKQDVANDAAALLALWRKLERTHLPVSFGCSCGGMGHVRVQDFEHNVLDYLREKHAQTAVLAIIARFTGQDNQSSQIASLLQGIAESGGDSEANGQLVADLRRSISSWSSILGPDA